jgi:hypothetical protein
MIEATCTGDLAYIAACLRTLKQQQLDKTADALDWAVREIAVRDRALEEACKTRPLLLCNTPGAGDCRHQTAEFYMQIARAALAREQEAAPDADRP